MTEVEKLSTNQNEQPTPETTGFDVAKAVRQQLESLQRAGMTHIPAGKGDFAFDWADPQPDAAAVDAYAASSPSKGPQSKTESVSAEPAQPTSPVVKESPAQTPNYDVAQPVPSNAPPMAQPAPPIAVTSNTPSATLISSDPWGPSLQLNDRKSALNVLREEVAGCTKCDELSSKRTQTVFGVGNPAARLVFVGEGPGAQEDRTGEPFVGEAGQLLDKIMTACQLSRSDVFILNTIKCRPPGNRNPSQTEIANCWGYAERQLEIIQPEFICCLGSVAARTLLKTTQSLGKLRKQFHSYRGSRVLVTYHPAYLLRTPSAKRHVWDDMKMLLKEMGVDLSM